MNRNTDFRLSAESVSQSVINIFPNPVTGRLTISISDNTSLVETELFSLTGQKINIKDAQSDGKNHILDLSKIPAGVYILQLSAGNKIITEKITKI